ncbi:hypothetical protein DPEC_G00049690 [Dallia pectoralis]|uniref:Uncharacterized protein n=1 Tax=Dallia pectoralis TaxID=75939 RepID=A0ACC2HAT2_DALPE|nr:hypothetical protein DPEC_G00049690 [Dallia pectoralis]
MAGGDSQAKLSVSFLATGREIQSLTSSPLAAVDGEGVGGCGGGVDAGNVVLCSNRYIEIPSALFHLDELLFHLKVTLPTSHSEARPVRQNLRGLPQPGASRRYRQTPRSDFESYATEIGFLAV